VRIYGTLTGTTLESSRFVLAFQEKNSINVGNHFGLEIAACAKPGNPQPESLKVDAEQQFGVQIVLKAIEEPLRWIARNAGQEGSVVVNAVRLAKGSNGYNAATDEYEDLMKAGIIDPTKVVRTALQNAASVASLLLTTDALVSDLPEKEKEGAGAGHGGHGH